jgi:hypothetical protein
LEDHLLELLFDGVLLPSICEGHEDHPIANEGFRHQINLPCEAPFEVCYRKHSVGSAASGSSLLRDSTAAAPISGSSVVIEKC